MRKFFSRIVLCILAIPAIALCGCDDLGEYVDVDEYYASFGEVVLIDGITEKSSPHLIEDDFYNKESRENFLVDDNGEYHGADHGNYVYMAIPLNKDLNVDSIALFLQSMEDEDVTLYINVYVTSSIPENWKSLADNVIDQEGTGNSGEGDSEVKYDDPSPDSRVGEITIHLKAGKWSSFVLDRFIIGGVTNGVSENSIQIYDDQIILLQFRNNSGVREMVDEVLIDTQSGQELQTAQITMTNLLIRALDVEDGNGA